MTVHLLTWPQFIATLPARFTVTDWRGRTKRLMRFEYLDGRPVWPVRREWVR